MESNFSRRQFIINSAISLQKYHDALEQAGIKLAFYESPGTVHEWLAWLRDLKEFAPCCVAERSERF